jgi:hypothetical protein
VRIGYSCWGFLGPGITDTPDGGRSHRRTLIDGLIASGHDIVFLQPNRDLDEACHDLTGQYTWESGLPAIDALFLEWRWPIPRRNTSECGTRGHTCDLHRQAELLKHYSLARQVPTIVWDKDLRLEPHSPLRLLPNVTVCEAALAPSPGASSLLFPVADADQDNADPAALAARPRPLPLAYVGNQYDRDEAFTDFFAPAATRHSHRVAGKWPRAAEWPHVNFTGRCAFPDVKTLYESTLATVLLVPDRYARAGQMTQRIFESVLAGCLPITPATLPFASAFTPEALHARNGRQAADCITQLQAIAGTARHAELIAECTTRLGIFRLSRQLATIDTILRRLTDDSRACPTPRPAAAR